MLFVIEGCDRCGKTSLANRIADKVGNATVIHAGPPTRHPLEEYETALDDYNPQSGKHLILDRWHVGEQVWPKIFGRKSSYEESTRRHVEMFMRSRGAFVIYATRDTEKLRSELVANNEPLRPDDVDKAKNLFLEALYGGPGGFGVWDYERHNDRDVDNFIWNAEIRAAEVSPVWAAVGPGWVGSETPTAVLVGDELGPLKSNTAPPNDIPFAPYAATSGKYLIDALENWRCIALVNSVQGRFQHHRNLSDVIRSFGKPRVVALGDKAAERLTTQEVEHVKVPHPQYWRRFRYNDIDEYVTMLKGAAGFLV